MDIQSSLTIFYCEIRLHVILEEYLVLNKKREDVSQNFEIAGSMARSQPHQMWGFPLLACTLQVLFSPPNYTLLVQGKSRPQFHTATVVGARSLTYIATDYTI